MDGLGDNGDGTDEQADDQFPDHQHGVGHDGKQCNSFLAVLGIHNFRTCLPDLSGGRRFLAAGRIVKYRRRFVKNNQGVVADLSCNRSR